MFIRRGFGSLLKEKIKEQIPDLQRRVKTLVKEHGNVKVSSVDIGQIIGGMKELPCMFYPASALDPQEGIRFRNFTIPDMQKKLPKIGREPLPEAVFWLLLTGQVPSSAELKNLQEELITDEKLPESTSNLIKKYAKTHHGMTVFSMAVLDIQNKSVFANLYAQNKIKKDEYWAATYEDSITLLKMLPQMAALIYTEKYGKTPLRVSENDWAGRYSNLMGYDSKAMSEALRGYLAIHCDHEGGNVSAHAAYLVNSALSDIYLSFSAALNGLAGPLHGLANQNVLHFLLKLQESLKKDNIPIKDANNPVLLNSVTNFVDNWLKSSVVPGYGHGKLRNTDPRYTHLKNMSNTLLPDSELVTLVHACEQVIPAILKGLGKVKNPFPNVDAHSGAILYDLGMKEYEYYTVIFGVSRALGVSANMIWARALGLPLERPGSLTLEQLEKLLQ